MKNTKLKNNLLFILVFLLIGMSLILSFGFSNTNFNNENVETNITYRNINDIYLNKLLEIETNIDFEVLDVIVNKYRNTKPLTIGVTESYMYYHFSNNNTYGIIDLLSNYFSNILNIPTRVVVVNDFNFEQCDLVISPDVKEDLLSNHVKSESYFNTKFYIYGKDYFSSDISNFISRTVYVSEKYKDFITENQLSNFEEYNINLVFTQDEKTFLNENDKNIFYIDNELFGLENNQYYYTHISRNFIGKSEHIYYNRDVNGFIIESFNEILKSENFKEIIKNYYYNLLQLEVKTSKFFTNEELQLISKSKSEPLVFENVLEQSTVDFYSENSEKWEGPLINIWENISDITGLNYTFTVRKDKTFSSLLKDLKATPPAIDGTFTILNTEELSKDLYFLNAQYETPLVFVGKVIDTEVYSSSNLYDRNIGIVNTNTLYSISDSNLQSLNVYIYNNIDDAYKALIENEISLIGLTYENYQKLFYKQETYNIEVKKVTPFVLEFTSAISKNNNYSDELYSLLSKTLLTIDENQVYSNYLTTNSSKIDINKTMSSQLAKLTLANSILFIAVAVLLAIVIKLSINLKKTTRNLVVIEHLAFEDSLTSLKNNIAFSNDLEDNQISGTIFVININEFRLIDINYSHRLGNLVLKSLAYTLLAFSIEKGLQIYRVGNDTFALSSEKPLDKEKALHLSHEILNATKTPMDIDNIEIPITIRIGIATCTNHDSAEETYYKAESASIQAKKLFIKNETPICIEE